MLRNNLGPVAATLALCAAAVGSLPSAHAVGNLVDVQVVDRGTGETLTPVLYKGDWWIAGNPGARYGVTLLSRNPQRTLNVVSIDGVNAISGDTAAWNQIGYVLDAYQRNQIDGWRKNMNQLAAFEFTALPDSYAARTGRPANVGVIGVATFSERRRVVPVARARAAPAEADRTEPAPSPAGAPPSANADAPSSQPTTKAEDRARAPAQPLGRIGTGHGEIEESSIQYVAFQRAQSTPNEIVTIHYDRVENLIALGILPPALPPVARASVANPFPNSGRFVADPPPR